MARLSPVHALWNPASARINALDWMAKISPDCTSRAINPFALLFFMTMSRSSISPRRGILRLMHCSSKIERTSRSVESPVPAVLGLDWPGNCPRCGCPFRSLRRLRPHFSNWAKWLTADPVVDATMSPSHRSTPTRWVSAACLAELVSPAEDARPLVMASSLKDEG